MSAPWVTDPKDWAAIAELAHRAGAIGWDSETYGHNVKKSSPAFRAKIDVWSLAMVGKDGEWHGVVLPVEALEAGPLRGVLEDPDIVKYAHNANHDLHAAANYGVTVRRVVDTLSSARLAWPGLLSYTLKALRVDILGKPERETFKQLTRPVIERIPYDRLVCVCCKKGCRKKSYPHVQFAEPRYKEKKVKIDIDGIVPGHKRWLEKCDYAAADAEDAPELGVAAAKRLDELCLKLPELPW